MTKRIVAVLAALLFGVISIAPVDAAPRGQRFYHGAATNIILANVFEAYLKRDQTGTSLIDPKKCATPGDASCGTGVAFLEGILDADPHASVDGQPLTLALIPKFLRKVRMQDPEYGVKYWMDCMVRSNDRNRDPSGWMRLHNCVSRAFRPGEKAYVDPDNGLVVLAQDCDNPRGKPEKSEDCNYILVPTKDGDEVRAKDYGPLEEKCPTGLKRVGETDFESLFVERCPDFVCPFDGADNAVGTTEGYVGSFPGSDGVNVVRVAPGHRVFFCILHADYTQSCGIGVESFDYVPAKDDTFVPRGAPVATIYYDAAEAAEAKATTTTGQPTRLWWHELEDCPE